MTYHQIFISEGLLGVAEYFSWCAYPEIAEVSQRDEFVRAVICIQFKLQKKHPPVEYRARTTEVFSRVNRGISRISRRLQVVRLYIMQAKGVSSLSSRRALLNAFSQRDRVFPGLGAEEVQSDNLRRWENASLPVAAMLCAIYQTDRCEKQLTDILYALDVSWIHGAMDEARSLAPDIHSRFAPTFVVYPLPKATDFLRGSVL